jgi:S1-C subfamily serine protease
MVLRLIPLALLLGVVSLEAQVPARAPTRAAITTDTTRRNAGWLGFSLRRDVDPDSLIVLEVALDSPAEGAGLRKDDRILMVDGRPATRALLQERSLVIGDTRHITLQRGDETMTIAITAGPVRKTLMPTRVSIAMKDTVASETRELRGKIALRATKATVGSEEPLVLEGRILRPARKDTTWQPKMRLRADTLELLAPFSLRESAVAGAELEQLNPGLAEYFGGVGEGVFVLRIAEGTPAATAGLRPGDIVQSVNGRRVSTIGELRDAVADASGTITLRVLRKGTGVTAVLRKE